MIDRISKNHDKIWVAGIYYIPAVLLYVINMFIPAVRPGVCATLLMVCVASELIIRRQFVLGTFIDRLVAVYILYNALSVIWLLKSGKPFSVYSGEFVVSLLPMIFYFAGRSCTGNDHKTEDGDKAGYFFRNFIIAVLITGILGMILQMTMPRFYIDYLYNYNLISKADAATARVRMDSVVGSTVLGFLGAASMIASIPLVMKKGSRIPAILAMLLSAITVFASNQRSAMVVVILAVVYFNYLLFFAYDVRKKRDFLIELIVIVGGIILFCVIKQDAAHEAYNRLVSLPGAIGQRSEQWIAAINNMYSTWLGNGLGANGHRALGVEDAFVVADGGLVKTYCEQGIFGFSMFIYIIILTFRKGLKDLKSYCAEVGIIAAALLQSIGSNILAFQLAVPVFWFAIGSIHSKETES